MADLGARRRVLELVVAFRQTRCVRVAAELELADHLLHGPRSAEELASATGAYAPFLRRLLRALTALGLVEVLPDERYGLTALGGELTEGRLRRPTDRRGPRRPGGHPARVSRPPGPPRGGRGCRTGPAPFVAEVRDRQRAGRRAVEDTP